MADREQVLSWLEWLTFDDWHMYHSDSEVQNIAKAAFDLLKEQEAVRPTWSCGKPYCGSCGLRIRGGKYCSECGAPIAWEGR